MGNLKENRDIDNLHNMKCPIMLQGENAAATFLADLLTAEVSRLAKIWNV